MTYNRQVTISTYSVLVNTDRKKLHAFTIVSTFLTKKNVRRFNRLILFQKLIEEVQNIEAKMMADFAKGLTFAFEQFEKVGGVY